ncbi:MAG TPA: hypothetical protein VEQ18_04265 [Candidatus Nitrosocosmicus sp.]|nr:hypothetical protein [Candidatus Nitrosocosmicus sp.]
MKIPDMISPQRALRYPYNKVQGPPTIVGWTMMVSTTAGVGSRTHDLLIGGHEPQPLSHGQWCLNSEYNYTSVEIILAILKSKFDRFSKVRARDIKYLKAIYK